LIGIQGSENILPDHYEDEECLGSLRECVLLSGFGLLSLHFELNKFSFTGEDIIFCDHLMKSAKLQLYRLFVYKQRILNNLNGDSKQLKPHILGHMIMDIILFACRRSDDVAVMEASHKFVKEYYRSSSKRKATQATEMYDKLQAKRLMSSVINTADSFFDTAFDEDAGRRRFKENENVVRYTTAADVEFSCSGYLNDFHDMVFDSTSGTLKSRVGGADRLQFLSSLLTLEQLTEIICTHDELEDFVRDLAEETPGSSCH